VLDNCEHVVEAASDLASRLLRGCAHLVQVTTGRRPLRVTGEVTWPVPPLGLPALGATSAAAVAGASAAELFADRAAAVRPGFRVDDDNAADVAAIVRALDGLPLAIELAAAHADVLPVEAIRRRLADHFELLETDLRDMPARQRTLRAVIESSVDLLTDAERCFFVRLGAFAGSFDLAAAAAVTGGPAATTYRLTASLVRQSLVVPTPGGRYRLLESLRVYAAEALAADPSTAEVRQRHLDHLLELMTTADEQIRTDAQEEWLTRVRESLPDLRSALRWSLGGAAPDRGALLAATSAWYWTLEGMLEEARQWLDAAEAAAVPQDEVRAALSLAVGRIAAPLGEVSRARAACAASVEISRRTGDERMLGAALVTLGIAQWALGDLTAAAASHDEAVDRLTAVGDRWNRTAALVLRARTAIDAAEAQVDDRIATALASARQCGDKHLIGLAVIQQARRAVLLGDARAGYEAAEHCLTGWRQVGYLEGEIGALNLMARASLASGQPERAEELLRQSLRTAAEIRHRGGLYEGLECLAAVRHATGQDDQALRLLTVAGRERRRSAIPIPASEAGRLADLAARVRAGLGESERSITTGAAHLTVDTLLENLGLKR
jgi:predicted ATPase